MGPSEGAGMPAASWVAEHAESTTRASGRLVCDSPITPAAAMRSSAAGDWSIEAPINCACELCRELRGFLAASAETRREWKLAKAKRKHIHAVLDARELPVRHHTRRTGSPFTLVLEKQPALFEGEARPPRALEADLAWLKRARR